MLMLYIDLAFLDLVKCLREGHFGLDFHINALLLLLLRGQNQYFLGILDLLVDRVIHGIAERLGCIPHMGQFDLSLN